MINGIIKWMIKTSITLIVWVFVLSIRVDGRTLFSYAHEVFIENSIVRAVDSELATIWSRFQYSAQTALGDKTEKVEKGSY